MPDRARQALVAATALRVACALMMVIHGVYRIAVGGVSGFATFLDSQHVPLGLVVAWVISIVEVAGGLTLVAGFLVRPLCAWFAVELTFGALMVHRPAGWFVVGGGRNGMEYAVLLIACFTIIAFLDPALRAPAGQRSGAS